MKIVHWIPGRIRVEVPQIYRHPEIVFWLEGIVLLQKGVVKAEASSVTGRILVWYNPDLISVKNIIDKIHQVIQLPPEVRKKFRIPSKKRANELKVYELEKLPLAEQFGLTAITGILLFYVLKDGNRRKGKRAGYDYLLNTNDIMTVLTGVPVFRTALDHLLNKHCLSTELVAGTISIGSLFVEESRFGLFVLWLVYLNTFISTVALESVRDRIRRLLVGRKPVARIVTKWGKMVVPGDIVARYSRIEVRAGEQVPADGIIETGSGLVNQFPIHGRRLPLPVSPGEMVYAGSILFKGRLILKTLRVGEATYIGRLLHCLKGKKIFFGQTTYRLINRMISLALVTAGGYYLGTRNLKGALNILVASMPGAAGLAKTIPAELAAIQSAASGVLVKNGKYLAKLGMANSILIEQGALLTATNRYNRETLDYLTKLKYRLHYLPITIASCKPEGESARIIRLIRHLQQKGHIIGMVGTGNGDTPPLSSADVGITNALADDLHLKSADIIIAGEDPRILAKVAWLARNARQIACQNMGLTIGSSAFGLGLGLFNLLTPQVAGLIQNLSTIGILANSGRLLLSGSSRTELRRLMEEAALAVEPRLPSECFWKQLPSSKLIKDLKTDPHNGLAIFQIQNRLQYFGPNQLPSRPKPTVLQVFWGQIDNYMSKVLLGLSGLSLLLGKTANAFVGSGVLLANTVIAVIQENQTQKSLRILTAMVSPKARVIRDGKTFLIFTRELVPGDIIRVEAGEKVPADARILEARGLVAEEASLTGESAPVFKQAGVRGKTGCIFMGTGILAGKARAVVTQTGSLTEMGRIAGTIGSKHNYSSSPIFRRLDEVGHTLVQCGIGVSGLSVISGLLHGKDPGDVLVNATSLAVSVIPDGLIPMITMTLALGTMRMSQKGVLIRQMPAMDTLGRVSVLCTDKTGTLTQNRMEVREILCPGEPWRKIPPEDAPKGEFRTSGPVQNLFRIAVVCNNAIIRSNGSSDWITEGDSTEAALLMTAAQNGLVEFQNTYRRVAEIPFSSETMQMTVICTDPSDNQWTFIKGAPEAVLKRCQRIEQKGRQDRLSELQRENLTQEAAEMSKRGLRVLAFAYQNSAAKDNTEDGMIFSGFIGITDPPRPEAAKMIAGCRQAGIKVAMITGDHRETALAIAKQLRIVEPESDKVLTGEQLDGLNEAQMIRAIRDVRIFARMSPRQKLRLIQGFKKSGKVIAMMGDGINDAPAICEAQVGMAIGNGGAGVTREMAPVNLVKDDLACITMAFKEGRVVYDNIRKSLRYSLTTNLGDGLLVTYNALLGRIIPIEPLQLCWINITGDPFVSWTLAKDRPGRRIMNRQPRQADESVFSRGLGRRIITRSVALGVSAIWVNHQAIRRGDPLNIIRTQTMATLALGRLFHLFDCRREDYASGFWGKPPANPEVAVVGAWMLVPILAAIYLPWLRPTFNTAPLSWSHWRTALLSSGVGFFVDNAINYLSSNGVIPEKKGSGPIL